MKLCLMAAGNFNVGDNALLHSWLSALNRVLTAKDIVYVLGIEPSYIMQYSSRYRYRIAATNVLYRYFAVCADEAHMQRKLINLFGDVPYDEFSYELRQTKEIFTEIDLLHIIGGGIINCMWLDMQYLTMAAIELAKRNGKRVIMTGQTLGPFNKTDEERLLPYLHKVDLLDLRDDCPWLRSVGIHAQVTVDDVMAYMTSFKMPTELSSPLDRFTDNKYITVCLQSWNLSEEDHHRYIRAKRYIGALLNEVLEEDPQMHVYFLEFMHFDGDKENNREVYDLLNESAKARCQFITCSNFFPFDVAAFAGKARFCITTRLHLSIFSMMFWISIIEKS